MGFIKAYGHDSGHGMRMILAVFNLLRECLLTSVAEIWLRGSCNWNYCGTTEDRTPD